MIVSEQGPTTKPGLRCALRRLAGVGAGMLGLALVTATTATVVAPPGPVAADQVSDLKAQATQIAQDLVLEQLQINTDQQQYDVDVSKVQQDQANIRSTEDHIQSDIRRVGRDRNRLEAEAVWAYIHTGAESDGNSGLFEGNKNQALARTQYEEVAGGDITLSIDALHTDENGLRAQQATLDQQEAQDQATTSQEASVNDAAHQTEAQLESKQSEITGKLAVAVAQQQAAQAAAAAAAVRAAQATVRQTAPTSTTQPAPSGGSTTSSSATTAPVSPVASSSGDPALPPFLQCVLQAESSGNYAAVSPGGTYMGGFQFSQATWNEAAQLAGMPQLINVPPNVATPAQQDDLAIALYQADGEQPWNDSCRNS